MTKRDNIILFRIHSNGISINYWFSFSVELHRSPWSWLLLKISCFSGSTIGFTSISCMTTDGTRLLRIISVNEISEDKNGKFVHRQTEKAFLIVSQLPVLKHRNCLFTSVIVDRRLDYISHEHVVRVCWAVISARKTWITMILLCCHIRN